MIPDRDPRKERLAGFALRVADCVLGASDFTAAYARSLGVRRVSVVKNGSLTPDLAEDARAQLQLDPDAFVVGGLGRLHDQKGWDVLCAAAALVHRRRRHFVFVVVGGGPGREALLARPDAAHVHFVGYRPRADSLLGAFDLLVVPSRYEAFGRVAAEGMLAGVPVIASSVGGLPEVIGEDGVLVPPEDPAALATAIVELGGNERMRATLVERARRRAQELFTVDRMASETASVIEGVLERAGAKVEG